MPTDLFHIIDDGVAVLRLRGKRFRQVALYQRGDHLYAKLGADFVRLLKHGGTSDPSISWLGVDGVDSQP